MILNRLLLFNLRVLFVSFMTKYVGVHDVNENTKDRPFACPICSIDCKRKVDLRNKLRSSEQDLTSVSSTLQPKHACNICSLILFCSKPDLQVVYNLMTVKNLGLIFTQVFSEHLLSNSCHFCNELSMALYKVVNDKKTYFVCHIYGKSCQGEGGLRSHVCFGHILYDWDDSLWWLNRKVAW